MALMAWPMGLVDRDQISAQAHPNIATIPYNMRLSPAYVVIIAHLAQMSTTKFGNSH